MLFSDFSSLIRILVVGVPAYLLVVLILRISGKRTLSKMNAFDFIVTVALGSILATTLTSSDLALVDGILAFALLIFLQFLATWLSVRSEVFSNILKSSPKLLYYEGQYDRIAMKKERIPKDEILQAIRASGYATIEEVTAVVLETDGTFSVIEGGSERQAEKTSSLVDVSSTKDKK